MSAPHTNARDLFAAARDDGPESADRDALFRKIALSTGIAAGTAAGATVISLTPAASATGVAAVAAKATTSAGTAATAAAAATPAAFVFGTKLLALGVLLGAVSSAIGVVVAVTMGVVPGSDASRPVTRTAPTAPVVAAAPPTSPGAKAVTNDDTATAAAPVELDDDANAKATAEAKANAEAKASAEASAKAIDDAKATAAAKAKADAASAAAKASGNGRLGAGAASGSSGDLAEEARLVTAARSALVSGDPARALALVQATRKLGARSLEPEELGLEARALRALGRTDDAAAAELVLRRRYPDHALAR